MIFAASATVHHMFEKVARADQGVAESGLPLPSSVADPASYQACLYAFLEGHEYDDQPGHLGWERDKQVRDTGDYINKTYYGTHPAVRVYYSPSVFAWLVAGDRTKPIPDGAMIVKEQYEPPAARWEGLEGPELRNALSSWSVMIRDAKASKDGWYWASYAPRKAGNPPQDVDKHDFPFVYPNSGFGLYCVRCHASAASLSTFSSMKNIKGDSLRFRVDDSWRAGIEDSLIPKLSLEEQAVADTTTRDGGVSHGLSRKARRREIAIKKPRIEPNKEFLRFFDEIAPSDYKKELEIPNITFDRIVAGSAHKTEFFTSDQCLSCHSGMAEPYRAMFFDPSKPNSPVAYADDAGVNVSPFGEWRWSMMGLSGRDPVFHAQVAAEVRLHGIKPGEAQGITDTCFSCHGVMGHRQLAADRGDAGGFTAAMILNDKPEDHDFKYGALARDGVSCMACHRIVDKKQKLADLIMGKFSTGPAGELYGPYVDAEISKLPMQNSLGIEPKFDPYVSRSRLCASCHVLRVPIYRADGEKVLASDGKPRLDFEQTTYLEWLNSEYQDEYGGRRSSSRSCQQCHMPGSFKGAPIKDRIATIQDDTYPQAENLAETKSIRTRFRDRYSRHELLGINVNVLEMFNQFDDVLGVRKTDFMTGSTTGLAHAIDNANRLAGKETAEISITSARIEGGEIVAEVSVKNTTGHRFPSGVGFRRAFIEFNVFAESYGRDRLLWASGRTNELGIVVDGGGKPLPSEFFEKAADDRQQFQPHFSQSRPIQNQDQVQIYEEVSTNPEGVITTSFLALNKNVKDNRLLPKGWSELGPKGHDLESEFLEATYPVGEARDDPDYRDGGGGDSLTYRIPMENADISKLRLTATLYYQSLPPHYLKQRFRDAPDDLSVRRLHYIASHLDLSRTHAKSWKSPISHFEWTSPGP